MIVVVPETSQRDDRVDDRWKDRADAVAFLEVVDHPLFARLQRFLARGRPSLALEQLESVVSRVENSSPEAASRRHVHRLVEQKLADTAALAQIQAELESEMKKAVDFAVAAPYPAVDEVAEDVYA